MTLLQRVQTDIIAAMKAREEVRLGTLRLIKAALDKWSKDQQKPHDEQSEQRVLESMAKQRQDSIEQFTKGNRLDLVQREQAESAVIQQYLLAEVPEPELIAAIDQAVSELAERSAKQMGAVMKSVREKLTGKRIDNKIMSEKVKAKLI